jgi:RNA-binding protein NOB1
MKSWASVAAAPAVAAAAASHAPVAAPAVTPATAAAPAAEKQSEPVAAPAIVVAKKASGPSKRVVVVDTNSLINNVPLVGDQFVTVAEVLEEVRDAEARRRLETTLLATRIETRAPSKEAVQKVIAFANATGDFAVLSAADIKLIAVTRMIEIELNGEVNLRSAPSAQALVYKKPVGAEAVEEEEEEEEEKDTFYDNVVEHEEGATEAHEHHAPAVVAVAAAPPVGEAKKKAAEAKVTLPGWGDDWVTDASQLQEEGKTDTAKELAEKEEGSSVACLTSDFAMQNVLLQMGLRVLSPDGRRITRVKQWALRCFACFKITRDMEKLFCPQVGVGFGTCVFLSHFLF